MRMVLIVVLTLVSCMLFLADFVEAGARKNKQRKQFVTEVKAREGQIPGAEIPRVNDIKAQLFIGQNVRKVSGTEMQLPQDEANTMKPTPSIFSEYWAYRTSNDLSRKARTEIEANVRTARAGRETEDKSNASIEQIKLQYKTQMLEKRLEILTANRAPEHSIQGVKDALKVQRKLLTERASAVK